MPEYLIPIAVSLKPDMDYTIIKWFNLLYVLFSMMKKEPKKSRQNEALPTLENRRITGKVMSR